MLQKIDLKVDDCMIMPKNARALAIGPSSAGKSTFFLNCIRYRNLIFPQEFTSIIYVNPNAQHFLPHDEEYIEKLRTAAEPVHLEVLGSIPTIDTLLSYVPDSSKSLLVLFDDMNEVLFNSQDVSELYVRISSHFNVSVLGEFSKKKGSK